MKVRKWLLHELPHNLHDDDHQVSPSEQQIIEMDMLCVLQRAKPLALAEITLTRRGANYIKSQTQQSQDRTHLLWSSPCSTCKEIFWDPSAISADSGREWCRLGSVF